MTCKSKLDALAPKNAKRNLASSYLAWGPEKKGPENPNLEELALHPHDAGPQRNLGTPSGGPS